MKIKPGFELRTVCRENILISHGRENINFSSVVSMNESAAFVWRAMEGKDFTVDDMAKAMMEEYEVDKETALADCEKLKQEWMKIGLLDD